MDCRVDMSLGQPENRRRAGGERKGHNQASAALCDGHYMNERECMMCTCALPEKLWLLQLMPKRNTAC